MAERVWRCLTLGLGMIALLGASASHAVTLTDDRGARISLATPPQRIVSLLPSLTETVCALGACERLVAVDTHSNWPPAVRALPHVGGMDDTQLESILALRPDLVLAATSTRAVARLESLGLKVLTLEPRTLEDFRRVVGQLDRALGTSGGSTLLQGVDAGLAATATALTPAQRGTRVYFEVSSAPYAASEASFIGQLLGRVGAANVVPGALGPFPKLNPEFIVRADPQVVMVSDQTSGELSARPGWSGLRALREGRVCRFTSAQADVLVRPGPRIAEGARLMVACIQGRLPAGRS
jgi:iron complex transport system substrate-binding protein